MSVGGHIIEIAPARLEGGVDALRLWCVDASSGDEAAVFTPPFEPGAGPAVGDEIWWQSGRIYFDGDRRSLTKIGNSHDPRPPK